MKSAHTKQCVSILTQPNYTEQKLDCRNNLPRTYLKKQPWQQCQGWAAFDRYTPSEVEGLRPAAQVRWYLFTALCSLGHQYFDQLCCLRRPAVVSQFVPQAFRILPIALMRPYLLDGLA